MGFTKRFDRDLYEKYDKLAKDCTAKLIDKRKYRVAESPKKRDVDLQIRKRTDEEIVVYVETEVKRLDWKKNDFLYPNVQLPERKKKYCGLEVPTIFVIWNKDQTAYISFTDEDVLKAPLVEVANRYAYKGEYFFQIPIGKCKQGTAKDKLDITEYEK